MPKPSSFSPLQLFTPIQLVFCLILFFLPWIDIQCVMPKEQVKTMSKEEIEKTKKEIGWDPNKPFSYATQSGLQIATGDGSPGSDLNRVMDKMKKEMGGLGKEEKFDFNDTPGSKGKDKKDKPTAPLLFLYPVALVAGIVLGFIPWPGMTKRLILAGVCLAALGVVGIQALIGFPIEEKMKKEMKAAGGNMNFGFGGLGGGGGNNPPGGKDTKSETKPEDIFRVSWKFPLYLTFLLLLGAAGTSFLDSGGGGGRKPKRKAYDFDDDEDEDEDDRPRKKKRRSDDDEDDAPPPKKQKKALSLDDDDEDEAPPPKKQAKSSGGSGNPFEFDEDEPPKKKKRRDDDDDDDEPPRKKRR